MLDRIARRFEEVAPAADYWTLRIQSDRSEQLEVRRGVVQPASSGDDLGAMVTVVTGGGIGYAATSDLSSGGLACAAREAVRWAERTAGHSAIRPEDLPRTDRSGTYESPVAEPWESVSLADKVALLRRENERLKADDRIVDWGAGLWHTDSDSLLTSSAGARIHQRVRCLVPMMSVTANEGGLSLRRGIGDRSARQGGLELLQHVGFYDEAPRIARQALELLDAPECPSGTMDLLLAPDQMILQIHESIGHPLELDRILGDERNYAGTSFVTPDMFGAFRYGSELLNVTFDPTRPGELASYAFDDEGTPAERTFIIRDGILLRGLGGTLSERRSGLGGCASSRATHWSRPPIDRMANLNLEPGSSRFEDMVAATERGVYMETNGSWSIDDSRNKFQFGCQWARRIEDGELKEVVRNPNYRGISANFWRSLGMVGDESTFEVMGTPFCGKGEPNQLIRVGHASPPCLFRDVDVFGGA